MSSSSDERWIKHLRKLAKHNADYQVEVRKLRMQVTALESDIDHYRQEFARQNARMLTMTVQMEVNGGGLSGSSSVEVGIEPESPEA